METKSRLILALNNRFAEMIDNHATHCSFTRAEVATMLDDARDMKVQLDNALDNELVVRNEINRVRGLFSTASKERDDMKRTADSSAEYLRQVEDVLITIRNERDELQRQLNAHTQAIKSMREERDDAVKLANERMTLIVQQAEESAKDKQEIDRLNRKLCDLQASVRQLEYQRNNARNDLIAAQGFCDKLRSDLNALSGQRDNEAQKAAALLQTCAALRNENSDLHNRIKTLSLKPTQYGAGGVASGCNNSIDAAKAQQSPLQELCRDRLRQTIKDGTWTQFPELRQYVAEIAINGEPNQ